jgi:prepilin-type N-terminal cleavage/methylation domain-containing protein
MRRDHTGRRGLRRGFTLLELLIVVVIIGIIVAFILTAAQDGIRRSEERATQALITKLEVGLADRVDAIMATRVDANVAHAWLGDVFSSGLAARAPDGLKDLPSNSRAQIVARFDYVKAELPDVFVVQNDTNYPLNFAAAPFPATAGTSLTGSVYGNYALPFGVGVLNDPVGVSGTASFGANPPDPHPYTDNTNTTLQGTVALEVTGMFGASFTAAAGLYKNLFKAAVKDLQLAGTSFTAPVPPNAGFDGSDNNNDGLIDNLSENGTTIGTAMLARLGKHTHKTARAEMLYALLVEGQGPFGSVFSPDDFRDNEVKDTDGDGLPEFVDAWGEPLQFYRWPVFYRWPITDTSNAQRGAATYGVFEARQQFPIDPNQKLVDPFWWSGASGNNDSGPYTTTAVSSPLSPGAFAFQAHYTTLTDPNGHPTLKSSMTTNWLWDRGATSSTGFPRRAYYSRFVVLSGGADKIPGVPVMDALYYNALLSEYGGSLSTLPSTTPVIQQGLTPGTSIDPSGNAFMLNIAYLRAESQAAPATPLRTDYSKYYTFSDGTGPLLFSPPGDAFSLAIAEAGNDDISSYNIQAPGGATQ